MRIVKASVYRSPNRPPDKGLVVFEDSDGWLYLKALVDIEGFATPFFAISEVETYLGEPLTLDFWNELDEQGNITLQHYGHDD